MSCLITERHAPSAITWGQQHHTEGVPVGARERRRGGGGGSAMCRDEEAVPSWWW
jgi:hypothetical protein